MVCVASGLLHDVVEDTLTTVDRIRETFGPDVAHIVEGVTKISAIPFSSSEERQAENFRKMLLAMVDDIRVIFVKLADRLHNMRTLQFVPEDRRARIAQETLDIYAPIANRLGMSKVKNELEELSFMHLEPAAYQSLKAKVEAKRKATEGVIDAIKAEIEAKLAAAHVPVVAVDGRIKRLYSIWLKLRRQKIELDQVYDFVAMRLVMPSVKDCYAALGIIHQAWSPVPGRIKDFIAMPRPNGYQSLHTSVISERGIPFEVQIRTADMHRPRRGGDRRALEVQGGPGRRRPRRAVLPVDAPAPRVAPGGARLARVHGQPEDRPLRRRGLRVHAARAGQGPARRRHPGRLRLRHPHRRRPPLRRRPRQRPDGAAAHAAQERRHRRDRHQPRAQAEPRLADLRPHRARPQQDRQLIQTEEKNRAVDVGRKLLDKEAKRFDLTKALVEGDALKKAAETFGLPKADDLLAQIGYGKVGARQVIDALVPSGELKEKAPDHPVVSAVKRVLRPGGTADRITVSGADDLMVVRARCCNPIRGERIVGYITRGKGVSVHSATCSNVVNLLYDPERRIDVEWDGRRRRALYGAADDAGGGSQGHAGASSAPASPTSTPTSSASRRPPAPIPTPAST